MNPSRAATPSANGTPNAQASFLSDSQASCSPSSATTSKSEACNGRLLRDGDGNCRLISATFWARLPREVEDLGQVLADGLRNDQGQHISTFSSDRVIRDQIRCSSEWKPLLQPTRSGLRRLWSIYLENVDPIIRVIHRPTVKRVVDQAVFDGGVTGKGWNALVLAISFAAVASLEPKDIPAVVGDDTEALYTSYKAATEQALKEANFIETHDLRVLQAFVILLSCVRRQNTRAVLTLTGLALSIARAMGLHRDGSHFKFSPFETEMRRRIWWQICMLDYRASEDHGCDASIFPVSFDTELPLNVNDADIHPDSSEILSKAGCSEMTFALIRFESWMTHTALTSSTDMPRLSRMVESEDKDMILQTFEKTLRDRYLNACERELSEPLNRLCSMVGNVLTAKLRIVANHPTQYTAMAQDSTVVCAEQKAQFVNALDILALHEEVKLDPGLTCWQWYFSVHKQWHVTVLILRTLCFWTEGDEAERAWDIIDRHFSSQTDPKSANMWKPLWRLKEYAAKVRAERKGEWSKSPGVLDDILDLDLYMGSWDPSSEADDTWHDSGSLETWFSST
ncbi:uncharacterized protein Z520_09157 [Fonsecaea multimorphosa CBS 102226]|uniref:Xylanolytic transcriptional activator regulatory domain-containing protein n=1 Tax=Fonsecaea multimorphosa CBS 102226 TaxID=1442371 RepID=A0A0D2H094_9EURO|nr:uncharacterized protein Z520_09157 [Fonsecaea multimorphosa CBS 102226]KIX95240.1 hypothetical protein Z520_09157 [Fonsecaea multimorphosa CBS 102226]